MVTFCDIPLAMAKDHIKKYGSYAIGLSKDWGGRKKLNPVIDIEKKSLISKDLKESYIHLLSLMQQNEKSLGGMQEKKR